MAWGLIFLAVPAGFLLGVLFFGGLWWTVQRLSISARPTPLLIASFLVRSAAILGGFYLLLTAGWQYLLAAMAGFLIARTVITYRYRPESRERRA